MWVADRHENWLGVSVQVDEWMEHSRKMLETADPAAGGFLAEHLQDACVLEQRFDQITSLKERINNLKDARFRPMQALLQAAGRGTTSPSAAHHRVSTTSARGGRTTRWAH